MCCFNLSSSSIFDILVNVTLDVASAPRFAHSSSYKTRGQRSHDPDKVKTRIFLSRENDLISVRSPQL